MPIRQIPPMIIPKPNLSEGCMSSEVLLLQIAKTTRSQTAEILRKSKEDVAG